MKFNSVLLFIFLLIVVFFGYYPQKISAQTCTGSISCCKSEPADCICIKGGSEIADTFNTCGVPTSGGTSCGAGGTCSCTLWCNATVTAPGTCNVNGTSCSGSCPGGFVTMPGGQCYYNGVPVTDPPGPSCTIGRVGPAPLVCNRSGLLANYTEPGNKLTYSGYTCGPVFNPAGTCGWYDGNWTGYFNAPVAGNYDFVVRYGAIFRFQIDVNKDGLLGACPGDNTGDKYYSLGRNCPIQDRTKWVRQDWTWMDTNGACAATGDCDPWPGCGNDGCTCVKSEQVCAWRDGVYGCINPGCDEGTHCQYVDQNVGSPSFPATPPTMPLRAFPSTAAYSEECPINSNVEVYNAGKTIGKSAFTRNLSAGSHKVSIGYVYNSGSAPDTSSHALEMWFRGPQTGGEFKRLSSFSTNTNIGVPGVNICPFSPCEGASSCSVSIAGPAAGGVVQGQTGNYTANVNITSGSGTVNQVNFSMMSGDMTISKYTVSPPYIATVSAPLTASASVLRADATLSDGTACVGDTINILALPPYTNSFSIGGGGDAVAAGAELRVALPAPSLNQYFMKPVTVGTLTFAGIAFGRGIYGLTRTNVNPLNDNWLVDSTAFPWTAMELVKKPETTYNYMKERILAQAPNATNVVGSLLDISTQSETPQKISGVTILRYTDTSTPLRLSGSVGAKKFLILVDGDVNITNEITIGAGGFLAILAGRDISIDYNIGYDGDNDLTLKAANVAGIYYAQRNISTGTNSSDDRQIRIDGTIVGMNVVNLERKGAQKFSKEYIEYKPEYTYVLSQLGLRRKIIQDFVVN